MSASDESRLRQALSEAIPLVSGRPRGWRHVVDDAAGTRRFPLSNARVLVGAMAVVVLTVIGAAVFMIARDGRSPVPSPPAAQAYMLRSDAIPTSGAVHVPAYPGRLVCHRGAGRCSGRNGGRDASGELSTCSQRHRPRNPDRSEDSRGRDHGRDLRTIQSVADRPSYATSSSQIGLRPVRGCHEPPSRALQVPPRRDRVRRGHCRRPACGNRGSRSTAHQPCECGPLDVRAESAAMSGSVGPPLTLDPIGVHD